MKTCAPRASGSALVVVLWVIGLLSLFVLSFAFDMHIEAKITSTWRKKTKAEYLARGGIELARMALLETADPDINNQDTATYLAKGTEEALRNAAIALAHGGGAEWTRELGEGSVTISIEPENGWMNINRLIFPEDREATYAAWEPLLETVGVPREKRDELVDCLLDWVDANELTHLNGVESQYYESLSPPYQAKNRALDTVDELALIKGFNEPVAGTSQTVYQAVAPFLTTYAEDQKININSATEDALVAFLDMDADLAGEIIAERVGPDGEAGTEDDKPFKDLNDLLARVPLLSATIADHVTFSAMGRFTLRVRGRVGDLERLIVCVVAMADKAITVLNWAEEEPAALQNAL